MSHYKLLAFDLDETLLLPNSTLSEYAVRILRAIESNGTKVVACTGRLYEGALPYLQQIGLDNPCIFCNGAQTRLALSGTILDERPLPLEEAKAAIHLGEEAGGHPRAYLGDRIFVSQLTDADRAYTEWTGVPIEEVGDLSAFLVNGPLKLISLMPNLESIPAFLEKSRLFFQNKLYITQSLSSFVEYMNAEATKGKGVKKLADRWGISREEIVVAGDHYNDLTMFAEASFSIAPANAQPTVREAASCVCLSNVEDGVAKKLEELFLK